MKNSFLIGLFLALFSCHSKPKLEDMNHLNGYWEIDHVAFDNGENKEYKINDFVDYYTIKGKNGEKQKGKPQLDGAILLVPTKDKITIIDSSDAVFIKTKSSFSTFTDKIISVSKDEFVTENSNKIKYHFKRYHPEK